MRGATYYQNVSYIHTAVEMDGIMRTNERANLVHASDDTAPGRAHVPTIRSDWQSQEYR